MIASSRPVAARKTSLVTSVIGMLPLAVVLNALAISRADGVDDMTFFVLLASDLIVVAAIGLLGAALKVEAAGDVTEAERAERDRRTLDALEPLRAEAPAGEGR
ncbi:hypothetical protein SMD11_1350 [Streptomyces albireticuli]|uniref:Uncharacterized protein n=1 Tax=Streptomyces albireticuli TaxID=1940 RepID=A0A1Z2KYI7_9ACTN|nr:hypothetical protein [Streptomyces albireticuli]ARZ67011.1 hypothetical protein SMD11_1350 [Streptomyces albireticuli]